jgi:hypothetical protein
MARDAARSAGPRLIPCFENGVDEDRPLQGVPGFELGQQLIEVMDIPGAFDLRQHHHVEPVADGADDLHHIVERPGRIERIDARP